MWPQDRLRPQAIGAKTLQRQHLVLKTPSETLQPLGARAKALGPVRQPACVQPTSSGPSTMPRAPPTVPGSSAVPAAPGPQLAARPRRCRHHQAARREQGMLPGRRRPEGCACKLQPLARPRVDRDAHHAAAVSRVGAPQEAGPGGAAAGGPPDEDRPRALLRAAAEGQGHSQVLRLPVTLRSSTAPAAPRPAQRAGTETSAGTCSSFSHALQPFPLPLALSPLDCWTYTVFPTVRDGQLRGVGNGGVTNECWECCDGSCWDGQYLAWASLGMGTASWDTTWQRFKTYFFFLVSSLLYCLLSYITLVYESNLGVFTEVFTEQRLCLQLFLQWEAEGI